jgi:hypothetical protein
MFFIGRPNPTVAAKATSSVDFCNPAKWLDCAAAPSVAHVTSSTPEPIPEGRQLDFFEVLQTKQATFRSEQTNR